MDNIIKHYQSPSYIFNIDILKDRIAFLKSHLPSRIQLCYAMKANSFVVKEIQDDVERIEVCSPGEFFICDKLGVNQTKLVISGVYKTPEIIEEMMQKNDIGIYTVEYLQQFHLLEKLSFKYKKKIHVLLRLTSGNQFGMEEKEVRQILSESYENIHIQGIQYFSGTQKTSLKRLEKEIKRLDQFLMEYENLNLELEYGAGFPVYYYQDQDFNEIDFLVGFSKIIEQMNSQGSIVLELGRSMAASCGMYLSRVVDMKTNKNGNYAILDGGMHQIVYYGQMMAMKQPYYEVYPKRHHGHIEDWNLCGSLCSINDILIKHVAIDSLNIGDIFVFKNTGAYCMSEGISLFLSRELPRVYFMKNEQLILMRDSYETYHWNMQKEV